MGAVLAQFFKLLKVLKHCRFEQIQKFFHHFITKSLKNYSVKKTKLGLGELKLNLNLTKTVV